MTLVARKTEPSQVLYEFENPSVNFCRCGSSAYLETKSRHPIKRMLRDQKHKITYFIKCTNLDCIHEGNTASTPEEAILCWNAAIISEFPQCFRLPFPGLEGLRKDQILNELIDEKKLVISKIEASYHFVSSDSQSERIKRLHLRLAWVEYGISWLIAII